MTKEEEKVIEKEGCMQVVGMTSYLGTHKMLGLVLAASFV